MTTKQSKQDSAKNQFYNEIEYGFYCEGLERQYKLAKEEGVFEILKVLELDKEHSDSNLVQAVDYFNENDGVIEKHAPMNFLTEHEKKLVNQDGKFHPELYCMLLSKKFADAIENKSAFIQHSFKYGFSS